MRCGRGSRAPRGAKLLTAVKVSKLACWPNHQVSLLTTGIDIASVLLNDETGVATGHLRVARAIRTLVCLRQERLQEVALRRLLLALRHACRFQ